MVDDAGRCWPRKRGDSVPDAGSEFLGVMYKSETLIYCSAQEKAFIA
jgi:hypothetical protein